MKLTIKFTSHAQAGAPSHDLLKPALANVRIHQLDLDNSQPYIVSLATVTTLHQCRSTIPRHRNAHQRRTMATTTMTTTAITAMAQHTPFPSYRRTTKPLRPPRSTSYERDTSEKPDPTYLKLLMPEPPADHDEGPEARIDEVQFFHYFLFHNRLYKNWLSIPVFPEDDDDMDPPLSPIEAQYEESEDYGDCESYDESPASPFGICSAEGPEKERLTISRTKTI